MSSLEVAFHLAAPCPAWLEQAWIDWLGPQKVFELYGGTELQAVTVISGTEWLAHRGSVGRAVLGEIEIRDPGGMPVPAGQEGEIWMRRGPGAPSPYHYIGATARSAPDGWESLGDIGKVDADGYVYITDRLADMILVGGANVYPAEIEAALDEHPAVQSCCVIGLPDEDLGSIPYAIVELSEPVSDADLLAHLRQRLAPYKLPARDRARDHAAARRRREGPPLSAAGRADRPPGGRSDVIAARPVALVTGVGRTIGIGAGIARQPGGLRLGHRLHLLDRLRPADAMGR